MRVIAVSTKHEEQQVALFCICYYDDGRPAAESKLLRTPSLIGSTISSISNVQMSTGRFDRMNLVHYHVVAPTDRHRVGRLAVARVSLCVLA